MDDLKLHTAKYILFLPVPISTTGLPIPLSSQTLIRPSLPAVTTPPAPSALSVHPFKHAVLSCTSLTSCTIRNVSRSKLRNTSSDAIANIAVSFG